MSGKRGWWICVGLALLPVGVCAVAAAQLATPDAVTPLQFRTWTNATGKFCTEAAMVEFADGKVHLKRKDGQAAIVPVGKLSKEDQRYVRAESARRAARRREQATRFRRCGGRGGGKAGLATCSPQGIEVTGNFSVEGSGPSWAHPVVIGGRLYLRYDSNLYCFDVRAGEL